MITLRDFSTDDIPLLLDWIPTYADMIMWAGPTFTWPLDEAQLRAAAEESATPARNTWMAVDADEAPVGHASIRMDEGNSGRMSRVVVAPGARGRGVGNQLVTALLEQAFGPLRLTRLELGVFEHNAAAISLYERYGFHTDKRLEAIEVVDGAPWTALEMSLLREP